MMDHDASPRSYKVLNRSCYHVGRPLRYGDGRSVVQIVETPCMLSRAVHRSCPSTGFYS